MLALELSQFYWHPRKYVDICVVNEQYLSSPPDRLYAQKSHQLRVNQSKNYQPLFLLFNEIIQLCFLILPPPLNIKIICHNLQPKQNNLPFGKVR